MVLVEEVELEEELLEEDEGVVLATGEGALVLLPPPHPQEIRKNTRRKERVLIKLK